MLLATQYIVLHAFVSGVFYIYKDKSADISICLDNGTEICEWTNKWAPFILLTEYSDILMMVVPENATRYKLQVRFKNNTYDDSNWKTLNCTSEKVISPPQTTFPTTFSSSTPIPTSTPTSTICNSAGFEDRYIVDLAVVPLLYYITICSSILIGKLFYKTTQKFLSASKWTLHNTQH